jgi:excisionase family DNA binding protein
VIELRVTLPEDVVEEIARRAAEIVLDRLAERERWPEFLSVGTAARYLDVSPERVRKLQARGELPYHQEGPGCRVLFRRQDLDEALERWRVEPPKVARRSRIALA